MKGDAPCRSGGRWNGLRRTKNDEIRKYKHFPTPAFAQIVLCIQQDGEVVPPARFSSKNTVRQAIAQNVTFFEICTVSHAVGGHLLFVPEEAAGVRFGKMPLT
jgi:hypothetical protein